MISTKFVQYHQSRTVRLRIFYQFTSQCLDGTLCLCMSSRSQPFQTMSLESVSGKSLPSRDVSNCALHAVCYPLPTAGFEALDIQKRMGHRTGSLGAGIAVGRWNHALLEQKVGAVGRRVDPQSNYYALTLWRQNSDITLPMIDERLRDNGYQIHLIEDVPTNPSTLGRSGLASMPIGFHRLVITDSRADHSQSRNDQIPGEEERLLNMKNGIFYQTGEGGSNNKNRRHLPEVQI